MSWVRRIFFFVVLNVVVVTTISIVANLLGIQPYLGAKGLNMGSLVAFCLLWGMGGAFISLLLSKMMAKWMMGVQIIDPRTSSPELRGLVETVHRLARQAGLHKMPEVGIYQSPEVNAFATGPSKNNSLVAVSTGLLESMNRDGVEGVLGHEVAHVANGDMVTMTLIQGVVNAFVMAAARVVAFAIDNFLRGDRDEGGGLGHIGYIAVVFVLELLFFIPGSMVVAWFSRKREYRADAGGAKLAGRDKMVAGLQSLQRVMAINMSPEAQSAPAMASLKISPSKIGGFFALMSTHPPLEERIKRLQTGQY